MSQDQRYQYMEVGSSTVGMNSQMKLTFPADQSHTWKLSHNIPYLFGGLTFLLGSCCYLPKYAAYELGGWLFTLGSAAFTFTDIFEWLKNNHVGCFADKGFEDSYAAYVMKRGQPGPNDTAEWNSLYWRFKRAEPGINFFMSVIGSTLYLIGSILFIPSFQAMETGTWIFIYGSAVIFMSQSWKLYRAGCEPNEEVSIDSTGIGGTVASSGTNPLASLDAAKINNSKNMNGSIGELRSFTVPSFYLSTMFSDLTAFGIDFGAGAGGFMYFIGSIYFLPEYDVSDSVTIFAAAFFIMGGSLFFFSGICMSLLYFQKN